MKTADWDLRKLQFNLDKNAPQSIYVLYGEETFLLDEALRAIKQKVLVDGAQDFNFDSFTAPENSSGQVRDAVETLPVMCERRLVVLKNADAYKDEAWNELLPIIESPVTSATLVILVQKLDKRKKIVRCLQEQAVFVGLKKPFDHQIPIWIDYIAHLNNVKLSGEAVSALQELVGTNLSEINNEIKKIQQYLGDKCKTIALQDVLKVVSRARVENVFNLTDAIGRRDRGSALVCLANLLEHGQNEIGIVSLIHRQIRILSTIYEAKKMGMGGLRLSQKVGVPEFFLKQYLEQARQWDKDKLVAATRALHETDKALKSSPISSHIWLENFILKTC